MITGKKILLVAGLGVAAYLLWTKVINKEEPAKKQEANSGFLGITLKKGGSTAKQTGGRSKCDCASGMKYNDKGWLNPVQNCQCKESSKN